MSDSSPFDPRELRRAFGSFATGVTIVTTLDGDGNPCGFTANSFTSVSIDPPLLLVSIAKSAHGCKIFTHSGGFAVNILARNQRDLSNRFASAGTDKFAGLDWRVEQSRSPIIEGVVAWFDCEDYEQVDAGDHIVLIGRILGFHHNAESPLGFFRGAYVSFGLSPRMLQLISTPGRLRVGAIVEDGNRVLLEQDADSGSLLLPVATQQGEGGLTASLVEKLAAAGVEVDLSVIYSAYHEDGLRCVYYFADLLSSAESVSSERLRFYPFDDIPWSQIADSAIKIMLERFIREKQLGNYAIYIGDHAEGEIYPA